jgi:hypothetical protein
MAESNHSSVPEGFKEIPGCDGKYFIGKDGRVWSCLSNQILTQHLDAPKKYLQSLLMLPGRKKGTPRYIHKLVALTWIGPAPGPTGTKRHEYCVNHKDGNKRNNHADNLEWVTNSENLSHAWRTGLRDDFIGENAPHSIFTSEEVRSIRLRIINGEKIKTIADDFNVGIGVIKNIQKFYSWKRQDWDLIDDMMKICKSKWIAETKRCVESGQFYSYSDINRYSQA